MLPIYALNIFVGALLLFLVQPMFTRMALPYLGGTPAVWNTAQVFFQAALLAGYSLAHATTAKLGARRQAILQLGLLLLPLLVLPIKIPLGWHPPTESNPIPWLLALLLVAVGLPFFAVSTTSPTIQKWFAATGHRSAGDPYFLYAASNLGSMLALLAYPALVEPNFTLSGQSRLWAAGYLLLVVLTAISAIALWRSPLEPIPTPDAQPLEAALPLDATRRLRWVLLAFVPSSLMLSVTTYISTDVASIPLMWIIPLALYLLSFIIVFARGSWSAPLELYNSFFVEVLNRPAVPPHRLFRIVLPLALLPLVVALANEVSQPLSTILPLHLIAFFAIAVLCHGEIARDRPTSAQLTEFYLWMAVGGVLGGVFNALLAPVLFKTVAEYPITLIVACLIMPPLREDTDETKRILDYIYPLCMALLAVTLVIGLRHVHWVATGRINFVTFSILTAVCCLFFLRPIRFGLGVAVILGTSVLCTNADHALLATERSFFGVHKVVYQSAWKMHEFIHGDILHGEQSFTPEHINEPLTYYHRDGPIGQFFAAFSGPKAKHSVAVVGLGTGTLACYAEPGQDWTFYEIDPQVERIARNPALFTYLRDCRAPFRVVLGDARLSLADQPDGCHDLIVLDAYSSDAIPVHLITLQAMRVYLSKLSPHGVIAFHISNQHLVLEPVVAGLAQAAGLKALNQIDGISDEFPGKFASQWVLVARSDADFGPLLDSPRWHRAKLRPDMPVWTDDYSSILSVFKWK